MNSLLAHRFLERPIAVAFEFIRPMTAAIVNPQGSALVKTGAISYDDYDDVPQRVLPPPYEVHDGGIAEIEVSGVLVHGQAGWYDETSYDDIVGAVMMAAADPVVKGIALHIESPGGEVDGCFEAADAIYGLRGVKPLWAIVDSYAYSAAYALASACDKICVPISGGTGSVGVVSLHMEMSKMLDDMGIKFTAIQFGDRKTDGSPYAPLSDRAKGNIQADVDELGEMFVDLVARNRGMSASAVKATQAGTFMGKNGVSIGFTDAICDPQTAFNQLQYSVLSNLLSQEK